MMYQKITIAEQSSTAGFTTDLWIHRQNQSHSGPKLER